MDHSKLVVAQSYGLRTDAELALSMLQDAGIQALLQADTAGGMREHLAWSGAGFKILVLEKDVDAARDLLTPDKANEIPEDFGGEEPPPTGRRFT